MPTRRLFLAALTCAAAALPAATAHAALAPVWQTPSIVSGPGTDALQSRVVAAPNGSIAVFWEQNNGSNLQLLSNIRDAAGEWSGPEVLTAPGEDVIGTIGWHTGVTRESTFAVAWANTSYAQFMAIRASTDNAWTTYAAAAQADAGEYYDGGGFATGADLPTMITTGAVGSDRRVRVYQQAAGGGFTRIADLDQPDSYNQAAPALAFNRDGDGIATWMANPPGPNFEIVASRYDKSEDEWSAPTTAFAHSAINEYKLAFNDSGDAAVLASTSSNTDLVAATLNATTGAWTTSSSLPVTGPNVVLADVVADGDGQFVAAWQEFSFADQNVPARAQSRTFSRSGGWSGAEDVADSWFSAGALSLSASPDGDVALSLLGAPAPPTPMLGVATRESGASSFDPVEIAKSDNVTASQAAGWPRSAVDALGNVVVVFTDTAESATRVGLVVGDGGGPRLDSVTVPSAAIAGESVSVAVNPFDLWSGVATTTWDFGDGGAATGATASHTFSNAGTYTVTVTANDLAGHSTSTTRQITVSTPPAPPAPPTVDPKPPVLAPVIEARLAGRTITLNARITLRKGKSCTGRATATTSFGTTTYRTSLKLAKVGSDCIGTGTIRLKKAPSTRTRLRVTVASKNTKTRTITTKRG